MSTTITTLRSPYRFRRPEIQWLRQHSGLVAVAFLLLVTGLVHGLQMTVTPALVTTDDEGTYIAQAWAILNNWELAHYTYWYDHPPVGWIQLAGWAWVTLAFERYDSAIAVGREFMLVVKLASAALMYVLCMRLGINRWFAGGAVLLFALSPLAVYYGRLTFLDNIATPWVLAAFALALSPQRKLIAVVGSMSCFAVAVLTKETVLLLAPALFYQIYQNRHPATWKMAWKLALTVLVLAGSFYLLMAILKNELLPGPGHVDLLSAIRWQLFDRASSGSVLDPTSTAFEIVLSWARLDVWLLALGAAAALLALLKRSLRPIAVAYVIQLAMMLRDGYLPQPYVIGLLPFAAIVLAGAGSAMWESGVFNRLTVLRRQIPGTPYSYAQMLVRLPVVVLVTVFIAVIFTPQWQPRLGDLMTDDRNVSVRQAINWVETHVPARKGAGKPVRIIVSDAMWVDLKERAYEPEWYFKVDLDPEVKAKFPNGWRDVDYVIFTNEMNEIAKSSSKQDMTTTLEARENGQLMATFGSLSETIWIYQVNKVPPG